MRYLWILTIVTGMGQLAWSQLRTPNSLYLLNKYRENCAYGGLEKSLHVVSSYRDQYSTLLGNPTSFYVGADMPFYIWNGAIGFSFQNQKSGLLNLSNIAVSYNRVFDTPYGFLSVGGRVGGEFLSLDGQKVVTPDGEYESTINHKDPFLDNVPVRGVGATWELSSYFYNNAFEFGLSMYDFPTHSGGLGLGDFAFAPSFSMIGQYKYEVTDDIKIRPSFSIKTQRQVVQTDASLMVEVNNQTFGGINLRGYNVNSFDALGIFFGTQISTKTRIAYNYDFGLSAIRSVHQGSHEISVFYNLRQRIGYGLPPKIIYNPRHF